MRLTYCRMACGCYNLVSPEICIGERGKGVFFGVILCDALPLRLAAVFKRRFFGNYPCAVFVRRELRSSVIDRTVYRGINRKTFGGVRCRSFDLRRPDAVGERGNILAFLSVVVRGTISLRLAAVFKRGGLRNRPFRTLESMVALGYCYLNSAVLGGIRLFTVFIVCCGVSGKRPNSFVGKLGYGYFFGVVAVYAIALRRAVRILCGSGRKCPVAVVMGVLVARRRRARRKYDGSAKRG